MVCPPVATTTVVRPAAASASADWRTSLPPSVELVDEARTSDDNLLRPDTSLRAETRQRDDGLRGGDRQVIGGGALDNRAADRMLGSTLERRRQRQNLSAVERH